MATQYRGKQRIGRKVRDNQLSRVVQATVLDVLGPRMSVRLATNGTKLHGIRYIGGPVSVGAKVEIDYSSGQPIAMCQGEEYVPADIYDRPEPTPSALEVELPDIEASAGSGDPVFDRTGWARDYLVNNVSTFSFDDGTRTFTLTPSTTLDWYIAGEAFTATSGSVQIDNTEGMWYIYYVGETLTASQTPWTFDNTKAFVCALYWDATNNTAILYSPEFHTYEWPDSLNEYMHESIGTRWVEGLLVSDSGADQLNVTAGEIYDEDQEVNIVDDDTPDTWWEQPLTPLNAPILYRDGASGYWRKIASSTTPCYLDTNVLQYNEWTGATWQLSDVTVNQYTAYFVVASTDITTPIYLLMAQANANTLETAKEETNPAHLDLSDLPTAEHKILARVIIRRIPGSPYYEIIEITDYRYADVDGATVNHDPSTFLDLTDTPSVYSGSSGLYVKVNSTEDGLEFSAVSAGAGDFTDLGDTPGSYSGEGEKLVAVNVGETALEFIDPSTVGETEFINLNDTPAAYAGHASDLIRVNGAEDALEFFTSGSPVYYQPGYLVLALSSDQTTSISAGDNFEFDVSYGNNIEWDGSTYRATLKAGATYMLTASYRAAFSGSAGYLNASWYDVTNTDHIIYDYSGNGYGYTSIARPLSSTIGVNSVHMASAIVTPDTDIEVEFRIVDVNLLTEIDGNFTGATIYEISHIGQYTERPDIYDDEERLIPGRWWEDPDNAGDYYPVYRKRVDLGTLPNATNNTVAHGLTNYHLESVEFYGWADNGTIVLPLPYAYPSSASEVGIFIDATNVNITTGNNKTAYTGYLFIEYAKTTDTPINEPNPVGGGDLNFTDLADTPSGYTADKWLKVNAGGTALELTDAPSGGGGASGVVSDPFWFFDGAIASSTSSVGLVWVAPRDCTINSVYAYLANTGTSGTTYVDVHLNGTTIFTTQSNRPTIPYNDADGYDQSGTPNTVDVDAGDILEIYIDQAATGAENLSVIIAMVVDSVSTFLDLSDTPNVWSAGSPGQVVRIDSSGSGLEFGNVGYSNVALFKSYSLSPTPSASYPDVGNNVINESGASWSSLQKLTDGDIGSLSYTNGTWVGWNTQSPSITLDLEKSYTGSLFRVVGIYGASGINRPIGVKLEYSDDDSSYTTVEDRTSMSSGGSPGLRYWNSTIDISGQGSHRYWKLTLTCDPQWLFVGELEFLL